LTLLEFFEDRIAPGRTAAAGHFTEGRVSYEIPSRKQYEDLMNDQIAHLNYNRTRDELLKLKGRHPFGGRGTGAGAHRF